MINGSLLFVGVMFLSSSLPSLLACIVGHLIAHYGHVMLTWMRFKIFKANEAKIHVVATCD